MKTIALVNQKGGVGKTCTSLNLGVGLHKLGKKVLLIDLDPQANLTTSLGVHQHELDKTIYDCLKGEIDPKNAIVEVEGISLLPSSLTLSGADFELTREPGSEALLKASLSNVKGFDYVLVDCPPSLGILTINALCYVKEIYVPLQVQFLALQGLAQLIKTVEKVKSRLNSTLEITGVIATQYDNRKRLNKEVVEEIRKHFGKKLFNTLIRDNISLAEAPSAGQSIFKYKAKSNGAEDYLSLSKEVIKRK